MEGTLKLVGLILGATAINVPLGYLRHAYERFTFGWFFYVHISIPIIIFLRIKAGFSWQIVPLTLVGAVVGQFLGGVLHRRKDSHG
ncbi:MAG: hypothetical protein AB9919_05385 [Geobacteraceae bacterium]